MRRRRSTEFGIAAGALIVSLAAYAAPVQPQGSGAWPHSTFYTVIVRPGDTLAMLAARYDVPADAVARMNRLTANQSIAAGEVLRIPAHSAATRQAVMTEALDRAAPNYAAPPKSFGAAGRTRSADTRTADLAPATVSHVSAANGRAQAPSRYFAWPVQGPVISPFGPTPDGQRNDGINIAATLGAPIRAAASGTVTYAGDELKGYGNLILIAHPGGYITAYAHAQSIAVARGDHVEKGQEIGTAGETGGVDRPQLHFEIREGLKPLNPVRLLAALP